MAKNNSKKKESSAKKIDKADQTTDKKTINENWFFLAMLANNLLNEVLTAIEKGELTVPNNSSFIVEEFKDKVGFIETMAKKTFEDGEDKPKQETPSKKTKLN